MDAQLVTTLIGGTLGLVTALAVLTQSNRRLDRIHRDQDRLRSVAEVVHVAAVMEGLHYRRARSASDTQGDSHNDLAERRRAAEQGLNDLYAAIAKAFVLAPMLEKQLNQLYDTERDLRTIADSPLPSQRSPEWLDARERHKNAIRELSLRATALLGTSNRRWTRSA